MNRRYLLNTLPIVALLAACSSTGTSGVSLDQVKQYTETLIDAISAAGQAYLASPNAQQSDLVVQVITDLQTLKQAVAATQSETDVRAIALQVVTAVQTVAPILTVFLGAAAPYVPLALAVIQAFIIALPPPPNAPPVPPAQLRQQAAKFHRA